MCFKGIAYKNVFCVFDEEVYEPSDDTFLLLEYLETMDLNNKTILEIGTGCGLVSIFIAKNFKAKVHAGDVNPYAILYSRLNNRLNGTRVDFRLSCLFEEFDQVYDIVLFNAPYLVDELANDSWIELATVDYGVVQEFLKEFPNYTKDYCLMVLNDQTIKLVKDYEILAKKKLFFEEIYLLKIYP